MTNFSSIGSEIVKNKFLIIAIILLIIIFIIFISQIYFNFKSHNLSSNNFKLHNDKENLYFKRLKYIIILILFLLGLTVLYIINPYNVITNYFGVVILLSIFIGTVILTMLSWYNYAYRKDSVFNNESIKTPPPVHYFINTLLFILFAGIVGVVIYFLVYLISPFTSKSNLISFLLNILIIIVILFIVYKVFSKNNNGNLFTILKEILFFVPLLILRSFKAIAKYSTSEYHSTTNSSILLLLVTMVIMYFYFKFPSFEKRINVQGGKQLINMPINTTSLNVLSSYEDLNGKDTFEYQYAISFWLFINSYPPNINAAYDNFVSLLNYGDKPNVLFNIGKNTLMVTMKQNGNFVDSSNNVLELDSNGNRIIYVKEKFLLQKWNNIIINFSGGTLDIFLNGELVKSTNGIVPYMKLDSLTVGTEKGIGGGICNLVYFNKSLTSSNIYYIYNTVKNKSPPVPDNTDETIIKTLTS